MLGCLPGRTNAEAAAEFERLTGVHLKPHNVSQFRQAHGLQTRAGRGFGADLPVGSERVRKDGFVWVKVAERPSRPGLRDNWRYKHVMAWEREHGRGLPEGWVVMCCDHGPSNCDPSNLLAVPRALVGVMNGLGVRWADRAGAEAVMAMARLRVARADLLAAAPRRCLVCGAEFTPPHRNRAARQLASATTCPKCVSEGKRSRGPRTGQYAMPREACIYCGEEFQPKGGLRHVCPACRAKGLRANTAEARRLIGGGGGR